MGGKNFRGKGVLCVVSSYLEWIFEKGKQVAIFSSGKQGIIKTVGTDAAEVELDNVEGAASIAWSDLHKHFIPGDFVEVTSGLLQEQMGWADSMNDEMVSFVEHIAGRKKNDASDIKVCRTPISIT